MKVLLSAERLRSAAHLGSRSAPAPYQVLPPPVMGSHARACFSLGHEIGVADVVSCFLTSPAGTPRDLSSAAAAATWGAAYDVPLWYQ